MGCLLKNVLNAVRFLRGDFAQQLHKLIITGSDQDGKMPHHVISILHDVFRIWFMGYIMPSAYKSSIPNIQLSLPPYFVRQVQYNLS
jgi:hypothetical protein